MCIEFVLFGYEYCDDGDGIIGFGSIFVIMEDGVVNLVFFDVYRGFIVWSGYDNIVVIVCEGDSNCIFLFIC